MKFEKASQIFLLFFLVHCSKFLNLADYGIENFELHLHKKFELVSFGSYGEIYRNKFKPGIVFKLIELEQVCKKIMPKASENLGLFEKKKVESEIECDPEILEKLILQLKNEIAVNENLKTYVQNPLFNFRDHFVNFEEVFEEPRLKFLLVFEQLQTDLQNEKFLELLSESSLLQKLTAYKKIVTALVLLHSVGVNHCDIKPENIMTKEKISPSLGLDGLSFKIIDFGHANFNKVCPSGTQSYSDPAQIYMVKSQKIFPVQETRLADVYSMGKTLLVLDNCSLGDCTSDTYSSLRSYKREINQMQEGIVKETYLELFELIKSMMRLNDRQTSSLEVLFGLERMIEKLPKDKKYVRPGLSVTNWLIDLIETLKADGNYKPENFPEVKGLLERSEKDGSLEVVEPKTKKSAVDEFRQTNLLKKENIASHYKNSQLVIDSDISSKPKPKPILDEKLEEEVGWFPKLRSCFFCS